jgi:hypothetical protein
LDVLDGDTTLEIECPACGSSIAASRQAETISLKPTRPERLGPFDIVELIGRGRFGDVYKARDTRLERLVALKLPREQSLDGRDLESFLHEARAAAGLRHPHIVIVHEIGASSDTVYIASEFIDGANLGDLLATQRLEPRRAAELAAKIADALHHAHEQGIVHRDLKPRNIMLDAAGEPHVLDFGLAKRDASDATISREGEIFGTPAYMAPEQARGQSGVADRRTDVYALGVTLYEMLTGQRPFRGEARGLLYQALHEQPPPPRRMVPEIPRDLETICLKAMSKEPEARYATAAEMGADLRRHLAGEPIKARRVGLVEQGWKLARRNPLLTAACGLAVVSLVGLLAIAAAWGSASPALPKREVELAVRLAQGPYHRLTDPVATERVTAVFWPLDREGTPRVDRPVRAQGISPVRTRLEPGEYFVVVVGEDSGRFHEVFRRVPSDDEHFSGSYRHHHWEQAENGGVRLADVALPLADVHVGMVRLTGSSDFVMGKPEVMEWPIHHRRLPEYYLDPREVTVGDFLASRKNPRLPAGLEGADPERALTHFDYDQALAWAEDAGKTLPTESQYEYAATRGGTQRFPWSGPPLEIAAWPIGPASDDSFDRTATMPPIVGLYSNAAEWTTTWWQHYPRSQAEGAVIPLEPRDFRIVRGAPASVVQGKQLPEEFGIGPQHRMSASRGTSSAAIGFRCARSVRPHLAEEDFERVLRDGP